MGLFGIDIGLDRLLDELFGRIRRKRQFKEATKHFLNTCINQSEKLGRDWVPEYSFLLDTERAFVPMWLASHDGRSESLATVLGRHDRLFIQGQAGSGKSTLVRFIALVMAKAALEPKQYGELPQQHLTCPLLFPLRVELSRCNEGQRVDDLILQVIPLVSTDHIRQQLDQGGVFILFDGLDEVADTRRRFQVLEEIRDLTDRLRSSDEGNRFLVTTRTASSSHQTLAGAGYALYTLQELTPKQQEDIIRRYYELWSESNPTADEASWQSRANELIEQLDQNPGLARLRNNPLLLSQIAALHFQGKSLPARRHELYEHCIRHLVSRRDRIEPRQREIDERLALLGEMALAMHQQKEREAFSRAEVERILIEAAGRRLGIADFANQASVLIERMEQEWGVLVNRASHSGEHARYSFSNLSFQEYLVAYIVYHYPDDHWPKLRANLQDDWWQEIILLYTAMPAQPGHPSSLDQVVTEFIGPEKSVSDSGWIKIGRCLANEVHHAVKSQWHDKAVQQLKQQSYGNLTKNVEALEALCQIEPDGREFVLGRILHRDNYFDQEQVMDLLRRMSDPNARQSLREALLAELEERPKIVERIALAEALGQTGDTRLGQLVEVPFMPGRKIRATFKIGRYLVTNVEYGQFVEAQGWAAPPHWRGAGYPLRHANHPVTHVSLSDALAYCEWLSKQTGHTYRLPTEAEWLATAEEDEPGRHFPWGGRFDQYYLNWRRNVGSTTPVGIYPEGETEHGVADLMGNVWEWTQDREGNRYVLKGGAWDATDLDKHVLQARLVELPSVCRANIGFRIIEE